MAFGGFQVGPFQLAFQQVPAGAPADTGPYVVLLPHEPLHFRTKLDFTLFALASFVKQEALRVRPTIMQMHEFDHRVPVHL